MKMTNCLIVAAITIVLSFGWGSVFAEVLPTNLTKSSDSKNASTDATIPSYCEPIGETTQETQGGVTVATKTTTPNISTPSNWNFGVGPSVEGTLMNSSEVQDAIAMGLGLYARYLFDGWLGPEAGLTVGLYLTEAYEQDASPFFIAGHLFGVAKMGKGFYLLLGPSLTGWQPAIAGIGLYTSTEMKMALEFSYENFYARFGGGLPVKNDWATATAFTLWGSLGVTFSP